MQCDGNATNIRQSFEAVLQYFNIRDQKSNSLYGICILTFLTIQQFQIDIMKPINFWELFLCVWQLSYHMILVVSENDRQAKIRDHI